MQFCTQTFYVHMTISPKSGPGSLFSPLQLRRGLSLFPVHLYCFALWVPFTQNKLTAAVLVFILYLLILAHKPRENKNNAFTFEHKKMTQETAKQTGLEKKNDQASSDATIYIYCKCHSLLLWLQHSSSSTSSHHSVPFIRNPWERVYCKARGQKQAK